MIVYVDYGNLNLRNERHQKTQEVVAHKGVSVGRQAGAYGILCTFLSPAYEDIGFG